MNCFKKIFGFVTPMRSLVASSKASFLLVLMFLLAFSACTDYEAQIDDEYEEWLANIKYGKLTDSRDGHTYKTVTIGSQIWMAENLNYETENSYCYNDSAEYCVKYGRLYTWAAATKACPSGWHLPDTIEWNVLFDEIGGIENASTVLKSTSGCSISIGNGLDAFGFSALPAGRGRDPDDCNLERSDAYFWSSTEFDFYDDAYYIQLGCNRDAAYLHHDDKAPGLSVRCLQDNKNDMDYSSSSDVEPLSSSSSNIDCSVTDGVKVFYPKGGEKFKMGDTITVIYGSDVKGSGYRFVFKTSASDAGLDMLEESAGPSNPDGKTCYEQKVYLTDDFAEPTETAIIRVIPYEKSSKGAISGTFSVREITDSKVSSTIGDMTDSRDGHTYKTVTIGSQIWMAENLNYETENSYCYNDSAEYCDKYGRLYTWDAAITVCPSGWHLPSNDEWRSLFTAVGGASAGKVLKSESGWYNDGNGLDSFGFSALPVGGWDGGETYYDEGRAANFWSSTEESLSPSAYYIFLNYDIDGARFYGSGKYFGFSVRCLQD